MEEYTNKYMLVFDTYDLFALNSADYVKGEDHIAYLIQENEVIYWLYLEQVWRPLNVRTTTTGQLEDGRSKVAVRLEYVEGGQKYTSVPNIPDPERITSMSHFLEDYPDIEEVNVTGTVNLTDLSYAFAGSKIRDFGKLDTSNVTNYVSCLENVNLNNDITINIGNVQELAITELFNNSTITNAIINIPNNVYIKGSTPLYNTTFNTFEIPYDENDIEVNESDTYLTWGDGINKYKTISIRSSKGNKVKAPSLFLYFNDVSESSNVNVQEIECVNAYFESGHDVKNIKIKAKKLIYAADGSEELEGKIDNREVECTCITKESWNYIPTVSFGYGFYKNPDKLTGIINNNGTLGNFFYTVPVVDDAFYADKLCPISIFQYKTTFEEVADVKITEATDSSLIYVDTLFNDFDCSNLNIEINNNINIQGTSIDKYAHYKKLIIDNTNKFTGDNYNNILDNLSYSTNAYIIEYLTADEGHISGYYKHGSNSIVYNSLFKDITFDSIKNFYIDKDCIDSSNIKFTNSNELTILVLNGRNGFDINYRNLLDENNNLNATFYIDYDTELTLKLCQLVKYEDIEVTVNINDKAYLMTYNKLANIESRPLNVNDELIVNNSIIQTDSDINIQLGNLYVNCSDDGYLSYLYTHGKYHYWKQLLIIDNIYGIVNIILPIYSTYVENQLNNIYKHIDVNKVKTNSLESMITIFDGLDDESTINLITKLIDNTSESTKTIYMYRSQANIIGDDNIAAAVAKNYEFAIIEN